jgi:hypothetical protein
VNWILKLVIVSLCFSLSGAGIFIASTARNDNAPEKTNVIPVKNRDVRPV